MSRFGGAVVGVSPGAGEGAGEGTSADATVDGPTGFEDLFRRRYEPMVRVAFLLMGARAEAEDVVQDAFARMELRWTRLDNPDGYAGLHEREIAEVLGVRPGTVKSMLHRALAQLREVIER